MNDENNEKGKNKIMDKCDETIKWLHVKQLAEEEFNNKQKEVEGVFNPTITKMYAAPGGAPDVMPEGMGEMCGMTGGDFKRFLKKLKLAFICFLFSQIWEVTMVLRLDQLSRRLTNCQAIFSQTVYILESTSHPRIM